MAKAQSPIPNSAEIVAVNTVCHQRFSGALTEVQVTLNMCGLPEANPKGRGDASPDYPVDKV